MKRSGFLKSFEQINWTIRIRNCFCIINDGSAGVVATVVITVVITVMSFVMRASIPVVRNRFIPAVMMTSCSLAVVMRASDDECKYNNDGNQYHGTVEACGFSILHALTTVANLEFTTLVAPLAVNLSVERGYQAHERYEKFA